MKKSKSISVLKSLVAIFAFSAATSAFADDSVYKFVSVGFSKPAYNVFELDEKLNFSYAPDLTFGFGKDYLLSDNWLVTNKIALRAQHVPFYAANEQDVMLYGDVKKIGLVAGSRLKFTGFSNTAMPFVEVEASVNDASLSYNHTEQSQWQKGYKISAGLEFKVSGDNSFSISVSHADVSDNDVFDSPFKP